MMYQIMTPLELHVYMDHWLAVISRVHTRSLINGTGSELVKEEER